MIINNENKKDKLGLCLTNKHVLVGSQLRRVEIKETFSKNLSLEFRCQKRWRNFAVEHSVEYKRDFTYILHCVFWASGVFEPLQAQSR